MEIDFLGLCRDSGFAAVKDEVGSMDSSPESASTLKMQRSFSNKVSKPSRMLSFLDALEEKPGKTTRDVSPKLITHSFQKNVPDAPAKGYYMANSFPLLQLQARSVGANHETKKFPVLTRPGQTLVNAPVFQSQLPVLNSPHFPIGHTAIFPTSRPQVGSLVSRDTRTPKSPGAPAQLTIFFAGSVCVYEDVSPEKAQAIVSLARNSSSVSRSKPVTAAQVQSQHIRPSLDEGCGEKNSLMLSFSSSVVNTQQVNTKQSIMTAPSLVQAVAIPQARKVSLARFVERRKERMIKASPYGWNKSSPEVGGIPSNNPSCSAANSMGSMFNSEVSHK